jgi:prophage regulatory protein
MAKKLLSKKQVKERVLYSYAHTARLEAKGQFPKRVRLGTGRVAYVEDEIDAWVQTKIDDR